ncbi:motility associated factor glycosyltransferase family protein [Clostridium sporogenes]|uniref:motility associated factor glycosyltransferase family protein n=1 Tax=Clostridium sporogenes TaxID=1509 RepID=UPI0009BBAAA5|nr:6-hydroxymethylpterin diphosphokinase MptE-like protein [Clostridium sporogenes]
MRKRDIKVFQAHNKSLTIKVDNILLHSAYHPEKVCEKFIENNKDIYINKKNVVVYGIGLGYHVQALLSRVGDDTIIHVFDVDKEIYNIGKNYATYKNFINDPRVKLYIGASDEFFYNLKLKLQEVEDILIYAPSLKILSEEYSNIKDIFRNFKMAKAGINEFKDIMEENYNSNLKEDHFTMRDFCNTYNFKDEKIIIAASGPSLDENIDKLKRLQGNIKIFSVGSALRTLIDNGINPYMICIIDPSELVYNQIKGFENLNIPLCFLKTASRWAVSKYNGPKYMFHNDENDINDIVINTGKTVAIPTMDIAVKGGAREVILIGQDLAFINNKSHTDYINESYKGANITNEVKGDTFLYKKVEGVKGDILYTRSEYLNFKHFIELEIKSNPQVSFINCSSGAKIKGTKYMDLEEINFV